MRTRILAISILIAVPGCVGTVAEVVTAPVRLAGKAVDLATTSQSEADEKRGREMRRREEEIGKLERSYTRNVRRCREGDVDACDRAEREYGQLEDMTAPGNRDY